jgi:hypothetical protein
MPPAGDLPARATKQHDPLSRPGPIHAVRDAHPARTEPAPMSISKPARTERDSAPPITRAVDTHGRVWTHHDPLALYRFIHARNLLLGTIACGSIRATFGRAEYNLLTNSGNDAAHGRPEWVGIVPAIGMPFPCAQGSADPLRCRPAMPTDHSPCLGSGRMSRRLPHAKTPCFPAPAHRVTPSRPQKRSDNSSPMTTW